MKVHLTYHLVHFRFADGVKHERIMSGQQLTRLLGSIEPCEGVENPERIVQLRTREIAKIKLRDL